jgi:AcrR family transcriptional regulator
MSNPAPKKTDRRIQRTRAALRQALKELISEKGYDRLTIEEITQRADLSRATFYVHYKGKDDLLLDEINGLVALRVEELAQVPAAAWRLQGGTMETGRLPVQPLLLVFQHIHENAEMYQLVLHGESASRLKEQVGAIIARSVNALIRQHLETDGQLLQPQAPVDFLASYFAGALLGSVGWWLDNGLSLTPEEMTRSFQRLFFPGLRRMLGLDDNYWEEGRA